MDFRTYRRVRTVIVSLLATALVGTVRASPGSPAVEFHIEGGDATSTLTEFSRQAHLQLLFDYTLVKGHTTKPLEGIFLPSEALRQLLANTDLDFDFVNDRTLAVTQKKTAAPPIHVVTAEPPRRAHARTPVTIYDGMGNPVDVIRITGTNLRFEAPVGQEIISVSRDDIESTGAATPADFLRTLPQAFGGGPNQDTHIGIEATTNSSAGVGVNLRGLGARATLVLINGRRVAPSGTDGLYVDIENLPLSALERIDILPDSASATYGADAVGGVVNFILRDKLEGAETILRGGSGTRGDLQEYLASQSVGKSWEGGHALLSFEFYDRGSLPASDRTYAVSNLRPLGGGNFDTNFTNPGNIISPSTGQTWAIPAGQNGSHLTSNQLVAGTQNLQSRYTDREIIPGQERWTLYGTGRQALGERMALFTDVLLGHREASEKEGGLQGDLIVPSTNPFYVNPAGGTAPIHIAYNFDKDFGPLKGRTGIDTLNTTLGLELDAGAGWSVQSYASYVREKQNLAEKGEVNASALAAALADPNPLTAFNPFGAGSNTPAATLQKIGTDDRFWLNSQLKTINITADGPIGRLAGIPFKLAVGTDRREEQFSTATLTPGVVPAGAAQLGLNRRILSAFGELVAPVFSGQHTIPGARELDLSAAVRYESYSDSGAATTPKYSIFWSPFRGIAFRGTWSRSVRPATLVDLTTSQNRSAIVPVLDPLSPGGMTNALVFNGGNSTARPEHAQSWTGGFDFAPASVPGLSLDLTYFRTHFTDRLQPTFFNTTLLSDPRYAAIITRNPSSAQISEICSHTIFAQGAPQMCTSVPVGALIDLRVRNLAALLTDGIDFTGSYEHPTAQGAFKFALGGTWLRTFSESQTPGQPLTSLLNTQNEPVDLRLRASINLLHRGWGAVLAANFTNSYRDVGSTPARRVGSWTTIDTQLRYDFPNAADSWLHGMRVELSVRNVFNVDPPFLNNQETYIGYDQENADPYGRLLSLELRKSW